MVARALPIPLDPPVIKTVYELSCQHICNNPSGCDKLTRPSTGKCLLDENRPIAALAMRIATRPIAIGWPNSSVTVMFRKQQDCEHCPNIQDAIYRILEASQTNKPNTSFPSAASFSSSTSCSSTISRHNTSRHQCRNKSSTHTAISSGHHSKQSATQNPPATHCNHTSARPFATPHLHSTLSKYHTRYSFWTMLQNTKALKTRS